MLKLVNALTVATLSALVVATMATIALGHTVAKRDIEILRAWAEPSSWPNAIELQIVSEESTTMHEMEMDPASMVKRTEPPDAAVLSSPPNQISITFAHPVRLTILKLSTIIGEVIPVEFDQATEASTDVAVPLPPLDPDDYTVEWRALGGDGHAMSGSFSFTVTAEN